MHHLNDINNAMNNSIMVILQQQKRDFLYIICSAYFIYSSYQGYIWAMLGFQWMQPKHVNGVVICRVGSARRGKVGKLDVADGCTILKG